MVTEPSRVTSHVSCPIFAGVAGDIKADGWTIQGPYHQFYTTDKTNRASERGIYSIFNYELGKAVNENSADMTAFLIYTKLGSTAASVTTGRNIHALDVLCEVDYDYAVTTNLRNADVRAARIQVYGHNNVSGVCHGAYINCQLNGGYTFNGRYVEATSSYGGIGLEVRTETSGSGTVTCNNALANLFLIYKGSNALTGNLYMLAINKPYEGGAVSGETVGIKFVNGNVLVGETDFDIGIDLADDCVIGIDIGDCTTGIQITGASTTGIYISGYAPTGIRVGGVCNASIANLKSIYLETTVGNSGVITGYIAGIHVETYVGSVPTVPEHYGIYVSTYSDIAGNKSVIPLRLEHNGASVALSFIDVEAQSATMRYFLSTATTSDTWGDISGTPSTGAGWLRVKMGGNDRYILLHSTAP